MGTCHRYYHYCCYTGESMDITVLIIMRGSVAKFVGGMTVTVTYGSVKCHMNLSRVHCFCCVLFWNVMLKN